MKRSILATIITVAALLPSPALGQSYLTNTEKEFLQQANDWLATRDNLLGLGVSDYKKLEYGKEACARLDKGWSLEEMFDSFVETLVNDRTLTQNERNQMIIFDTTINAFAIYRFCPQHEAQLKEFISSSD